MKRKYFKHADMAMCVWLNLHKEETTGKIYIKRKVDHHWDIISYLLIEADMDILRGIEDRLAGFTSFYVELK